MKPLLLSGMREQGVHCVTLDCRCGRSTEVNVDMLPGHIPVPDVKDRLRCQHCGERPWRTMPDWRERKITPGYPV